MRTPGEYIKELQTKIIAEGGDPRFVLLSYQEGEDPDHIQCDFGFESLIPDPDLIECVGTHLIRKAKELRERLKRQGSTN